MEVRTRFVKHEPGPHFRSAAEVAQLSGLGHVWVTVRLEKRTRGRFRPPACPLNWYFSGADDGIRTRDPNLGKVVLYQLSHVRVATTL